MYTGLAITPAFAKTSVGGILLLAISLAMDGESLSDLRFYGLVSLSSFIPAEGQLIFSRCCFSVIYF